MNIYAKKGKVRYTGKHGEQDVRSIAHQKLYPND